MELFDYSLMNISVENKEEAIKKIKDNFYIKKISSSYTKDFILKIHYARRLPCIQYAFGLFYENILIGVITYGQPASAMLCKGIAGEENRKNILELNRLVLLPEWNIKNLASYLIGNSLKLLPNYTFVVSYADVEGWHHVGYVYQATNWLYTGMTKSRTDKFSSSGHARHYDKDEKRRQKRTAKHRYIYLVGNKKEKKIMRKQLNYSVLPYPKGKTEHYNIENPTPFIDTSKPI